MPASSSSSTFAVLGGEGSSTILVGLMTSGRPRLPKRLPPPLGPVKLPFFGLVETPPTGDPAPVTEAKEIDLP